MPEGDVVAVESTSASGAEIIIGGLLPAGFVSLDVYERERQLAEQSRVARYVAGPPPPLAWLNSPRRTIKTPTFRPTVSQSGESLLQLSALSVAKSISSRHTHSSTSSITNLPFHLKQLLMSALAELCASWVITKTSSKNCRLLYDDELRVCDFSHSSISLKDLAVFLPIRAISTSEPGLAMRKTEFLGNSVLMEPPASWEDLYIDDGDDNKGEDHSDSDFATRVADTSLRQQQQYEQQRQQQQQQQPQQGCVHLTTLRLAFTNITPPSKLSHLLADRLSTGLTVLDLSGCFHATSGPAVLSVLSRSLYDLVDLNLSFCDWVCDELLQPAPSSERVAGGVVRWETAWRGLKWLRLVGCVNVFDRAAFERVLERVKPATVVEWEKL